MRAQFTRRVAVVGLAALMAACGGSKSAPSPTPNPNPGPGGTGQEPVRVTIPSSDGYGASTFSPGSVTVAVGRTVEWDNRDTFTHTTTSDTGVWSGQIGPNGSFSRTFTTAGTFNYHCTLHAGMTGSVTVQ